MTALIPPDRWTCPSCQVTEVPHAPRDEQALLRALRRAQERYAKQHAAALAVALQQSTGGDR